MTRFLRRWLRRIWTPFPLILACAAKPERPPCTDAALAAIVAECKVQEIKAGCFDDPAGKCPAIVAECTAKIRTWQACE